jgi:hypothetical protein
MTNSRVAVEAKESAHATSLVVMIDGKLSRLAILVHALRPMTHGANSTLRYDQGLVLLSGDAISPATIGGYRNGDRFIPIGDGVAARSGVALLSVLGVPKPVVTGTTQATSNVLAIRVAVGLP